MHKNIPNKFYFINSFKKNNIDKLDNNTGVIYRNYNKKLNFREIINIKKYCLKKKVKFYLSNNYKVAMKLELDGAYIPSFNKDFRHLSYFTKSSFITLGSVHNIKELRLKEIQKVELIFISSIFKKNKNFLGIYKFLKLRGLTKRKVIALGGISKINKKKLRLLRVNGFGGISYFE
tara:strand:+ start:204 stop:731 length:528 start_codon:yes stop_codon:yes gene_type:complete